MISTFRLHPTVNRALERNPKLERDGVVHA